MPPHDNDRPYHCGACWGELNHYGVCRKCGKQTRELDIDFLIQQVVRALPEIRVSGDIRRQ